MQNKSLYMRIGGERVVRATVLKMYDKILADEDLAPFFEHVDIDTLRRSQEAFVTYAFGADTHYSGKSLRTAHKPSVAKGLNDHHFNLTATYLSEAMLELNVPADLVDEAIRIVETTRADVLNK